MITCEHSLHVVTSQGHWGGNAYSMFLFKRSNNAQMESFYLVFF